MTKWYIDFKCTNKTYYGNILPHHRFAPTKLRKMNSKALNIYYNATCYTKNPIKWKKMNYIWKCSQYSLIFFSVIANSFQCILFSVVDWKTSIFLRRINFYPKLNISNIISFFFSKIIRISFIFKAKNVYI